MLPQRFGKHMAPATVGDKVERLGRRGIEHRGNAFTPRVGNRAMRWNLDEVACAPGRWRDAARVVAMRWDGYLGCEAPLRSLAYTSYLAALVAEEAAAAEVAKFTRYAE